VIEVVLVVLVVSTVVVVVEEEPVVVLVVEDTGVVVLVVEDPTVVVLVVEDVVVEVLVVELVGGVVLVVVGTVEVVVVVGTGPSGPFPFNVYLPFLNGFPSAASDAFTRRLADVPVLLSFARAFFTVTTAESAGAPQSVPASPRNKAWKAASELGSKVSVSVRPPLPPATYVPVNPSSSPDADHVPASANVSWTVVSLLSLPQPFTLNVTLASIGARPLAACPWEAISETASPTRTAIPNLVRTCAIRSSPPPDDRRQCGRRAARGQTARAFVIAD